MRNTRLDVISEDEGAMQNFKKNQQILNNLRGGNMRLAQISDSSDDENMRRLRDRRQKLQEILNRPQTDDEGYQSITD